MLFVQLQDGPELLGGELHISLAAEEVARHREATGDHEILLRMPRRTQALIPLTPRLEHRQPQLAAKRVLLAKLDELSGLEELADPLLHLIRARLVLALTSRLPPSGEELHHGVLGQVDLLLGLALLRRRQSTVALLGLAVRHALLGVVQGEVARLRVVRVLGGGRVGGRDVVDAIERDGVPPSSIGGMQKFVAKYAPEFVIALML